MIHLHRRNRKTIGTFLTDAACILWKEALAKDGGTSVAGPSVVCYDTLSDCNEYCYFECYPVEHCNDSEQDSVACAPDVTTIVVVTFGSIIGITMLCCLICLCSPCCLCAMFIRKRRERRQRNRYRAAAMGPHRMGDVNNLQFQDSKANDALI